MKFGILSFLLPANVCFEYEIHRFVRRYNHISPVYFNLHELPNRKNGLILTKFIVDNISLTRGKFLCYIENSKKIDEHFQNKKINNDSVLYYYYYLMSNFLLINIYI